jgi:hypothetical protein
MLLCRYEAFSPARTGRQLRFRLWSLLWEVGEGNAEDDEEDGQAWQIRRIQLQV